MDGQWWRPVVQWGLYFILMSLVMGWLGTETMGFYESTAFATLGFLLMFPVGYLSFRFVESPFLRLRRAYVRDS